MIFVKYDPETLLPLEFISTNIPDFLPQYCAILDSYLDEPPADISEVCITNDLNAVMDGALAITLAKERAILSVRNLVADLLSKTDIKMRVLDEKLRIDRSNESAIEEWYSVALSRQQIRDSSNICQENIAMSTSQFEAWGFVNNFLPTAATLKEPAPEITRNAFLMRLNLSIKEKVDPVFQVMTSDLLSLGYIDLRQCVQTIDILVAMGKLTRVRADQILQTPVRWGERPIHGV